MRVIFPENTADRYVAGIIFFAFIIVFSGVFFPIFGNKANTSEIQDKAALRICSDINNPPFSTGNREGFENKIAELVATELNLPVNYFWFPQGMGFIRNTLRLRRCDLIIGTTITNELVQNSNPYYSSTYVMVYKKNASFSLKNLNDPMLRQLKIGIIARTPPVDFLATHDLLSNIQSYKLLVDTRHEAPNLEMIKDLIAGTIDVGILWGPFAGYYVKQNFDVLTMVPLFSAEHGIKLDFDISMGLRYREPKWKKRVNEILRKKKKEIHAILHSFGVPLLNRQGKLISTDGYDS